MSSVVKRSWVSDAAKAITRKIGGILADVMQSAVEEDVFEPHGLEIISSCAKSTDAPGAALDSLLNGVRVALVKQISQLQPGPEHDENANRLYVEMLVRMVGANAVYRITMLRPPQTMSPVTQNATAVKSPSETAASNKLVQGLLHAFEVLQEAHMMDRSHYRTAKLTKAQLSSSAETPGWDTVPLMTLVHLVQRGAQTAGSAASEESLTQLVRSWRKLLIFLQSADSGVAPDFSRRRGALAVVNGLLMMLFQHNNTHQCRALLQSVEQNEKIADANPAMITKSVLRPASHMIAEVIKFRYYQGRMKLYEKRFQEAFDSFTVAYRLTPSVSQCSPPQRENKQRIHFYLLVTGLASGQQPPSSIMDVDSYCRHLFFPIIEAIREGNPAAFCRAIDRNASVLRRRGVYMLLQQARILCYLYLLQRVHTIIGTIPGADNSKISVSLILQTAKHIMAGKGSVAGDASVDVVDVDADETASSDQPANEGDEVAITDAPPAKKQRMEVLVNESLDLDAMCLWIARLISRGFVRGYLSYEHKVVVLSKASPFPTLAAAGPPTGGR